MNDAQTRQLIHKNSQMGRFNVQSQGRHIHNDLDSPFVFQPILSYIGTIGAGGDVILLPVGWEITYVAPSEYEIIHNLNTVLYSVTAISENLNQLVAPSIIQFSDSFVITWNDTATSSGVASTFNFTLTNINNKSTKLPKYYGTLIK